MHRAVAAIPALAVTLALFFLMQLLIAPSARGITKPVVGGGVGLVTLVRDSATDSSQGNEGSPLAPLPVPISEEPPPPLPAMAQTQSVAPPEPELTTDVPALQIAGIDALPFLGGPPVMATKKPAAIAKSKLARKKTSKRKSSKHSSKKARATKRKSTRHSRSAQAKASSKGRGKSARASAGKKRSGAGRGSGGTRGKGRSGKGSKSTGNSGIVVLSRPKPAYPRKALRNKEEGWVKVSFTVTAKGTVVSPRVVAAKPRRVFDRSALRAIRKWRFKPKTVSGKPVPAKATQLIEFKLARR